MGAFTSCMAPPAPQRSVPARRLPGPFENQAPLNENSRPNRLDGLADSGLHGGLGTGNDGPNRLVPTPQPDHEEHRRAEDQSTDEDDVRTKLPDRRAPQITPHPQIWNWKKGPQLGNGSFGTVYLGINSDTGGLMAVKQVEQPVVEDERTRNKLMASVRELEREVETLQKLRHPNIVQYYGIERTAKYINIFLEWVPGGSIRDLLNKFGPFDEKMVRSYTKEVLLGLRYLHRMKIMHRDIKGQNVLVDHAGNIKLSDFGASKQIHTMKEGATKDGVDEKNMSLRGTMVFMAPEVMEGTGHGRPADIWSLGCLVVEMLTAKAPWSDRLGKNQHWMTAMYQICKDRHPPAMPENLSPEGRDFLDLCWQWNPRNRPNCDRLLMHPFIKSAPTPRSVTAVRPMHPAVGMMPSPVQEERQSQEHRHDAAQGAPSASTPRRQSHGVGPSPRRKPLDLTAITPALGPSGATLTYSGLVPSPPAARDPGGPHTPGRMGATGLPGACYQKDRAFSDAMWAPAATVERPATAHVPSQGPTAAPASRPFTADASGPARGVLKGEAADCLTHQALATQSPGEGASPCEEQLPEPPRADSQTPPWARSLTSFNPMLSFQHDLLHDPGPPPVLPSTESPTTRDLDDDTVMTDNAASVHCSMLADKVSSVIKESMEISHFKQHMQNPLYGLPGSVSASHTAFATKMVDAVTVAAGGTALPPIMENEQSQSLDNLPGIVQAPNDSSSGNFKGALSVEETARKTSVTEAPMRTLSSPRHGVIPGLLVPQAGGDFDLAMEQMLSSERRGFREAYKSKKSMSGASILRG